MFQRSSTVSIVTASLMLAALQGCGPTSRPPAPPSKAYDLPAITITAPSDMRGVIDEGRGTVVVVNLWATWCPPCVKELPDLARFYEDSRHQDDVLFLSFSADTIDTLESKVHPFMKSYEVPFSVHVVGELDRDRFIVDMKIDWDGLFPTTYLFGTDGSLLRTWAGEVHYEELVTAVSAAGVTITPSAPSI